MDDYETPCRDWANCLKCMILFWNSEKKIAWTEGKALKNHRYSRPGKVLKKRKNFPGRCIQQVLGMRTLKNAVTQKQVDR